MLSHKAKYGLKAALSLASDSLAQPVLVADLAKRESIPKKFLEQILLELKHRGVLQSRRGKGGGYLLARPPSELSVGEVIRALDGPQAPVPCVSHSAYVKCDECLDETSCGVRLVMKEVRDATARILDSTTLADVLDRMSASAHEPPVRPVIARPPGAGLTRPDGAVPFPQSRRKARA